MEEIEYIPFYGELKMTTFTTDDRKEAAKKKPKKEKVVLTKSEPEAVEQAIVEEIVTARTEAIVENFETSKAALIGKAIEEFETKTNFKDAALVAQKLADALEREFPEPDVPEPGTVGIAVTPKGAHVTRRGFTTIHMAQAFLARMLNPEEYFIVEVREGNGLMIDGPILAYYVIHKSQEL
jgi:hypothetical protein